VRSANLVAGQAAVIAAVLVAGCGARGISAAPTATNAPVATPVPVVTPSDPPSPSPAARSVETRPGPPSASLAAPGAPPVPGVLGSYTWLDAGSDSPWIVPTAERAVRTKGPFTVAFQPVDPPVTAWTARWAPIVGGTAGTPMGSAVGNGGPIVIAGPTRHGTWTLLLDARFGEGRRAAYSWRLEPSP
jgi:hypothetical protein